MTQAPGSTATTRILLAEDQRLQARLLLAVIGQLGLDPVVVRDGEAAWDLLSGEDPPQIALLDWMMPGISGVEVCRRLLAHPRRNSMYLILLTSRDTTEDIVAGLEAGANDFVTKPFEPRELLARIQAGLRVVRLERELAARMSELERALAERALAEERLRLSRQREVEVADRIQQTLLLGAPPDLPGLEIAALSAASEGVDGDFYDFIVHGAELLDVVVGDVMGKGLPAALVAAAIKAQLLRALAQNPGGAGGAPPAVPSPAALLDAVARALAPKLSELERFATLVLARFDVATGRLTLVDAGHTATLIVRSASGRLEELPGVDPPLGISDDPRFGQVETALGPRDLVVFYSDGLTEARSPEGELFGVERLERHVLENAPRTPRELVESLHRAVRSFVGGQPVADDLTCVAVRVCPQESPGCQTAAFELDADVELLPRLRSAVATAGGPPALLDEARLGALVLAANEAFVNIVRHALAGRDRSRIRVEISTAVDRVEVALVHDGIPFDPETVPPPDFEGGRASGFGVYLIAASVDEVRYENRADFRAIRLLVRTRRPQERP